MTAYLNDVIEAAVRSDADPFAGLAADLSAEVRCALAGAIGKGAYAAAADEIDVDDADGSRATG